jgi:ADP-sugar diphosphatase
MDPITVDGISITAESGIEIEKVTSSKQFQDWLTSLDRKRFQVNSIHIQSVDMFGAKLGFVKFKANVVDEKGKFIPGIVFMRGGSVGILLILVCEGKEYTVLTVQPRIATGSFSFKEIPAGMLDGSGNFAGVAAKEIDEELGLKISEADLTSLSELAHHERGFFVSPGGTEETIRLFAFRQEVTKDELAAMDGKCAGVLSESEQITLQIIPLDDIVSIPDGKTIVAYTLYKIYGELIEQSDSTVAVTLDAADETVTAAQALADGALDAAS